MQSIKDDFYSHVNKEWLDNTIIPADKSSYCTFNILNDVTKDRVKNIIEDAINLDSNYKKIGILYNQGIHKTKSKVDTDLINNLLDYIESNTSAYELFNKMMNMETRFGITMPFTVYVSPDFDDSNINILYISSGGLGLSKEYYSDNNPEYVKKREQYKQFLTVYSKLFNLNIDINKYYELEKTLSEKTFSKEDKRNIDKVNNPILWHEFLLKYNQFGFIKQLFSSNISNAKMNIGNPNYLELVNSLIDTKYLDTWKQYFKLKFLLGLNSYLTEEEYSVYFNFYGTIMKGKKEPEPLWKRSIDNCERVVGELIGSLYSNEYFPKESKQIAEKLVTFIKMELDSTLNNLGWMEEQTKTRALKKLNNMNVKIGYPEKLEKDYDKLIVSSDKTYLENMLWSNVFLNQHELSKLYKTVNKEEWGLHCYEVNAYYNPSSNEIVFPAGILQEPFFSASQSDEKNFGGIGTVIGHEITHGFDDNGCRFDENGNLNDWWTENDKKKYKERTKNIEILYDEFTIEGSKLNGRLTLGENIADIGGVHIAYKALVNYLKQYNKSYNIKDFFYNYANIWKNKTTPEQTKEHLLNDPHSPAIFRVNGTLGNIDEFYKVFDIMEIDKLFIPEDKRGKIWL